MSVTPAPNPVDIQGFQFKLFSKLKIFPDDQTLQVTNPLSLVTSSSKYGILFVGCPTGFKVIQVSSLEAVQESQGKSRNELTEYPRRDIQLASQPSHIAVNSDGTLLAVAILVNGIQIIRVYSVAQFLSQTVQVLQEVRGSTTAGCVTSGLSWNPGIANMLAVCFSDGSASVYEFKEASYSINSIPPEAKSTCMCWSPKGKQIVIGSQNGTLTQYKPELKAVKNIQAPDMNQRPVSVVSVQWLSSFQFAAVYKDLTDENQKSGIMLVNTPKNGPVIFVDYEDICYSGASLRSAQFYLEHIQAWNLLLVASANSVEVGLLGSGETEGSWLQWILDDSSRAELPLDKHHQETLPVGMAWNTNSQHKLPVGENQFLPPMPLLCIYSHKGSLCVFLAVNLLPTSTQLCSAAELPADRSGLSFFVTSEPTATPAAPAPPTYSPITPPTSVTPVKEPVPVSAPELQSTTNGFQLPFMTGASPSVTGDQPQSSITDLSIASSQNAPKTWDLSFDKAKNAPVGKPASSTAAGGSLFGGTSQGFTFQANPSAQSTSFAYGAGSGLNFANTTNLMTPSSNLQPFVSSTPLPAAVSKTQSPKIPQQQQLQQQQQQQQSQPQQKPPQQQNTVEKPSEPTTLVQEEIVEKPEISAEVVHAAMIEEVKHFDSELKELLNSLKLNDTETYENEAQNKLNGDLALLEDYFKKQMESTKELQNEVKSLKMAGLELVGYVEDSKRRLHQHKKPGFKKLMFSNEIDPMSMRRLDSINKSMFYVESQLEQSNKILDDKWALNQDLQKPLRRKMFIPPGEELYLTVITQTNILNSQKSKLDKLQKQIKEFKQIQSSEPTSSRSRLPKTTTELSQLAENLLRVDLNPKSSSIRSRSSFNTSSMKTKCDVTSKSIMDESKDLNDSTQIPSEMMVRRIPKVITQSPFNLTGKDRATFIAESLVHNHKLCNTLVSKTVSNLSPTQPAATKTPTKDLSSPKKPEELAEKNVEIISNSFKPSSSQSLQSKTFPSDDVRTLEFGSSISFGNQSEMSFFKTPTKQSESAATKPPGFNFETPISKNQSNRENIGSFGGFSALSTTSTNVEQPTPVELSFAVNLTEKPTSLSSLSGAGITQEGKSPLTSISNLLEGLTPKPENKTAAAVSQPSNSFMLSTKTDKTLTSSSTTMFGGLKTTTSDTITPFSFSTPSKPEGKDNSPSNAVSFFKGANLFAGAKSESKDTTSPFSSISNSSPFANKGGSIFGGLLGTQTTVAGNTFGLDKPIFGSAPAPSTITTATTTATAAVAATATTTNMPAAASAISAAQQSTKVDSTPINITFGKPSEKTPVSSTKDEPVKTGFQTNLIFGGGSLQKTVDSGKNNVFAFQPSTEFSFTQLMKEPSDKAEGTKLLETATPVSSDISVKTAADNGVFGTSNTVTSSPVSFSFTQSLENAAISTLAATPAQMTPPTTTVSLQPVSSGSTGIPVMAAVSSTASPQPSTFSSLIATQSDGKVSSTVSESSSVSASSSTETVAITTQSPSVSTISFTNFNFGSGALPATSDANAKMTLNFNQSGPGISIFGGGSTTITPVQSTSSNVFGETPPTTAASKAATPFSFTIPDSNSNTPKSSFFGSKPLFGTPATIQPTSTTGFFASATNTPTTKPETGLFGQSTLSPFGQTQTQSAFGGSPAFGQPAAGSLFGQTPSSGFGSQSSSVFGCGGSVFGGGTSTDAAANQPAGGLFSSPATTGVLFGATSPVGSFSQPTSSSISQTGFGTVFQNKPAAFGGQPAFGAPSSFGGAPTFGGSATFGSPNKVFGSPPSAGGFGASTQQSTTFENLANQNTMSFGNLAQQSQSTGFGSSGPMFGSPQQGAQSTPPAFPNTFGGNSFSSWR